MAPQCKNIPTNVIVGLLDALMDEAGVRDLIELEYKYSPRIEICGGRIFYIDCSSCRCRNSCSGQVTTVFVHGHGWGIPAFGPVLMQLIKDSLNRQQCERYIIMELPGYGSSDRTLYPQDMKTPQEHMSYVRDTIMDVLTGIGCLNSPKLNLVGHSIGGYYVCCVAKKVTINRLILLSPSGFDQNPLHLCLNNPRHEQYWDKYRGLLLREAGLKAWLVENIAKKCWKLAIDPSWMAIWLPEIIARNLIKRYVELRGGVYNKSRQLKEGLCEWLYRNWSSPRSAQAAVFQVFCSPRHANEPISSAMAELKCTEFVIAYGEKDWMDPRYSFDFFNNKLQQEERLTVEPPDGYKPSYEGTLPPLTPQWRYMAPVPIPDGRLGDYSVEFYSVTASGHQLPIENPEGTASVILGRRSEPNGHAPEAREPNGDDVAATLVLEGTSKLWMSNRVDG